MKGVVLLSGGLDSTTALALALQECETVHCVSCHYGSKHNEAENQAARMVVDAYRREGADITHQNIVLPDIFVGANSALMGEIDMPHMTYQEIHESEGPSPTVVPFRNANLISVATAIAVSQGAQVVYIAAHGEDAHNWAYPDCTPEFLGAMANAVYIGTYNQVRLVFPFIWMMKSDIVELAYELGAPLEYTWSCYEGGDIHCGVCPTCVERKQAFADAGVDDPTEYEE